MSSQFAKAVARMRNSNILALSPIPAIHFYMLPLSFPASKSPAGAGSFDCFSFCFKFYVYSFIR